MEGEFDERPGGRLGMFMSPLEAADETRHVIGERGQQPAPKNEPSPPFGCSVLKNQPNDFKIPRQ
jgi:hypothetical protein